MDSMQKMVDGKVVIVNYSAAKLGITALSKSTVRSVHRSGGWTPQSIAEHAKPALKSSFFGLERSGDVFSWDPI